MDVSMPGLTGDEATERLKRECPGVKVLALTVYEDKGHLRKLLKAGASGYVLKLATGEELIRAAPRGRRGRRLPRPGAGGEGGRRHRQPGRRAGPASGVPLTERESQVLLRVARGFSNKEIAAQLDISVKTVETHKLRSMGKLGLKSRAEVVQLALRRGWLVEE